MEEKNSFIFILIKISNKWCKQWLLIFIIILRQLLVQTKGPSCVAFGEDKNKFSNILFCVFRTRAEIKTTKCLCNQLFSQMFCSENRWMKISPICIVLFLELENDTICKSSFRFCMKNQYQITIECWWIFLELSYFPHFIYFYSLRFDHDVAVIKITEKSTSKIIPNRIDSANLKYRPPGVSNPKILTQALFRDIC